MLNAKWLWIGSWKAQSVWFLCTIPFMACHWFVCMWSIMLFDGSSGVLCIMMPPATCHWRSMIALQVYIETWRLLCVLWLQLLRMIYWSAMSELSVRFWNFIFSVWSLFKKWQGTIILQYFEKTFWHHHHTKQHNVWNFSSNLPCQPSLVQFIWFFLIQSGFLAHILNFSRKAEKGLGPILMYSTPRICSNRLASGARWVL